MLSQLKRFLGSLPRGLSCTDARSVGKAEGQTNHLERWNNTLRQSNARYVRKTLSFSKSDFYHEIVTRLFSVRYNLRLSFEN